MKMANVYVSGATTIVKCILSNRRTQAENFNRVQ